jgi:fermentation-respiration switch protein FrsA (DUF1100 family)
MIQRQMMYPARTLSEDQLRSAMNGDPRIETVQVTTADQLRLNGFHFRTTRRTAFAPSDSMVRGPSPVSAAGVPVVLYFPGNGGCRIDRLDICEQFASLGCDVVLFDYRGYGDNPGKPSEKQILADARSIWRHLTRAMAIPHSRIVLYGESLGGAVATRLAADLSRDGTPPAGLFVSSSFSSMTDVASFHYPFLPVRWLLLDRYDSHSHIGSVVCPITMVHGTSDEIVPFELGRRLFASARPQSTSGFVNQFFEVPGVGHNDVPLEFICQTLESFVNSLLNTVTQ